MRSLILTALLLPGTAHAGPSSLTSEEKLNSREGCRRKIAGHYLEVYDQREQNRKALITYKDSQKEVEKALVTARADRDKAKVAADSAGFDLEKAAKRDQLEAYVNTLDAQLVDTQKLVQATEAALELHGAREKKLRAAIAKVFKFERVEDKPDGGYPMELRYKSPCPKYRYLCPLPESQVKDLLAIEVDGAVPEECRRYAGLPQRK